MKFIIVPTLTEHDWATVTFPEASALHLPIASKTLASHLLDYCSALGADAVRILDWQYEEAMGRDHLARGERWGLSLEYTGTSLMTSPDQAIARSQSFIAGDTDVRVIWGLRFPYGNQLIDLPTLAAWFDLNFRVLDDPCGRILPSYSAEAGVHIGENVALMTHAKVEPPVLLDDNTLVANGAHLAGNVIVGRNAYIDCGAELKHSIVFSHSYVGCSTFFENKIVCRSRVIDPATGASVDFQESGIVSRFGRRETLRQTFQRLWRRWRDPGLVQMGMEMGK